MPASSSDRAAAHVWVLKHWASMQPNRNDGRVCRPLNCFMLFRTWWVANEMHLPENNVPEAHGQLTASKRAARAWSSLLPSERGVWQLRADAWRDRHSVLYPGYKFSPRRAGTRRLTRSPPAIPVHLMRRRSSSVPPLPVGGYFHAAASNTGVSSMPTSPIPASPVPEGWSPSFLGPRADPLPAPQVPGAGLTNAMGFTQLGFGGEGSPFMEFSSFPLDSSISSPAGSSAHYDGSEFSFAQGGDIWENSMFQFPPADGGAGFMAPSGGPFAPFPGAPFVPEGNFAPPSSHQPALPAPVTPFPLVPSNAPVGNDYQYVYAEQRQEHQQP
ncbi:hypothetical protein AURDEDRAFT_184507 [Auricularia subglabra TFB-10046 SS5]|nr:hypothetical protein AURDEDRAFT_184507 [Auricularia subglabra TFB-10046 SS5]